MINGREYSYYGLIPIKHFGFLDMPSRVGETYYDWGEYIEPLVHIDDIHWAPRNIYIDFYFDSRITSFTFREAIAKIAETKGYFPISNRYGEFNVKLKEVKKIKHVGDSHVIYRLFFQEENQQFKTNIPAVVGGYGPLVDGYSFLRDFEIYVEDVVSYDDYPTLKESTITTEFPNKPLTDFRIFKFIEIKCAMVGGKNETNAIDKLKNFQAILSLPGIRIINYKGVEFESFLTEGFKTNISGKINFSVKLNVLSQSGIFPKELFDIGLFNTGNERKYLETLFDFELFKNGIFQ